MRISDWSSDVCSSDLQIVLGDAELEMLAARRLAPALGRDDLDLAEHVLAFATREDATLVHPATEVGRHRHVRRGGYAFLRQWITRLTQLVENLAETLLYRHPPPLRRLHSSQQPQQ